MIEMARYGMPFFAVLLQCRFDVLANIHHIGTARIEPAARGRVQEIRRGSRN